MGLASTVEGSVAHALVAPRTIDRQSDRPWRPSPEDGHRLIQAFVRIERPDLREKIFNFITEMLKAQVEGR